MAWFVLKLFRVKIQLTATKSIEINLPGGGAKSASDITGVELFSPDVEGCRAVRLVYKKKAWHLAAADIIKAPDGEFPTCWEDTPHQPSWEMPRAFQAPHAAIAVHSGMSTFAQSTPDAVVQDMMAGLSAAPAAGAAAQSDPGKKRFGIKRDTAAAPKSAPASASPSARKPSFPNPGECVSENGRRFVTRPMVEPGFHLCATLPEFQTLWLSRLLPEGKRPTASSIQVAESSMMASVFLQPEFRAANGNALVIFALRDAFFFAGYKDGEPVLWLKCPSVAGTDAMRAAVIKTLGVGEDLVDSILNESLIDPRPALEPFSRPVLAQLELSLAYLASKHSLKFDKAFLMGMGPGAAHWSTYAEESLKLKLIAPDAFDGLVVDKGVKVSGSSNFLVALGAAIAGAEVSV